MRKKLEKLVGRYVRLKNTTFRKVSEVTNRSGGAENFFVVAAIAHGMDSLICYGANIRITVSLSDVVLV